MTENGVGVGGRDCVRGIGQRRPLRESASAQRSKRREEMRQAGMQGKVSHTRAAFRAKALRPARAGMFGLQHRGQRGE